MGQRVSKRETLRPKTSHSLNGVRVKLLQRFKYFAHLKTLSSIDQVIGMYDK